jgi:hypothetical protein
MKYLTFLMLVFASNISLAHNSTNFHIDEVIVTPLYIVIGLLFFPLIFIFLRAKKSS